MRDYFCTKCGKRINLMKDDYDLFQTEAVCPVSCDDSLKTQIRRLLQSLKKWWKRY